MATTNKNLDGMSLLKKAAGMKKKAETKLQGTGAALAGAAKNFKTRRASFQKAWEAGKVPGYATFNPFKEYK